MAMDFETVRFLRIICAIVFGCVGAAAGIKYYDIVGAMVGAVIGAVFGWNLVDLFKGRTQK